MAATASVKLRLLPDDAPNQPHCIVLDRCRPLPYLVLSMCHPLKKDCKTSVRCAQHAAAQAHAANTSGTMESFERLRLAQALEKFGYHTAEEAQLRKVSEIFPDDLDSRVLLGQDCFLQGLLPDAIMHYVS